MIRFVEDMDGPVDQSHVGWDEYQDGLKNHHHERPVKIFVNNLVHVNLIIVFWRVNRPITCLEASSGCLSLH